MLKLLFRGERKEGEVTYLVVAGCCGMDLLCNVIETLPTDWWMDAVTDKNRNANTHAYTHTYAYIHCGSEAVFI